MEISEKDLQTLLAELAAEKEAREKAMQALAETAKELAKVKREVKSLTLERKTLKQQFTAQKAEHERFVLENADVVRAMRDKGVQTESGQKLLNEEIKLRLREKWIEYGRTQSVTSKEDLQRLYIEAEEEGTELISGGSEILTTLDTMDKAMNDLEIKDISIHPRHASYLAKQATSQKMMKTRKENARRKRLEDKAKAKGLL